MTRTEILAATMLQLAQRRDAILDMGQRDFPGELSAVEAELRRRHAALPKINTPDRDTYSAEVVKWENEMGWKYN